MKSAKEYKPYKCDSVKTSYIGKQLTSRNLLSLAQKRRVLSLPIERSASIFGKIQRNKLFCFSLLERNPEMGNFQMKLNLNFRIEEEQ